MGTKKRTSPISSERAEFFGYQLEEASDKIRYALAAMERGDKTSAREWLQHAQEHCQVVRDECTTE